MKIANEWTKDGKTTRQYKLEVGDKGTITNAAPQELPHDKFGTKQIHVVFDGETETKYVNLTKGQANNLLKQGNLTGRKFFCNSYDAAYTDKEGKPQIRHGCVGINLEKEGSPSKGFSLPEDLAEAQALIEANKDSFEDKYVVGVERINGVDVPIGFILWVRSLNSQEPGKYPSADSMTLQQIYDWWVSLK